MYGNLLVPQVPSKPHFTALWNVTLQVTP